MGQSLITRKTKLPFIEMGKTVEGAEPGEFLMC